MVVGGSRQETLNPNFVLLGTRRQGVPVILRELVLPDGFDLDKYCDKYFPIGFNNMSGMRHGSKLFAELSVTGRN
ncbi:unnamed protein product [Schistosoma mattheei]|uniref:Uncharacterized protein n=1 Tax=Schistosoma mattheei TaxID=31246 RepID=A0A183NWZ7_9TREM|nr:unnamed protein product [Schistosoma mattheei]